MTGPAVTTPVTPPQPHVLTGDEWESVLYAPHRIGAAGDDPRRPMGAGRILTGDEWDQAQRAPSVSGLTFPAMPRFQSDVTRTPASEQTKGTPLPAFDIRDPSTYLAPVLRQVVNPTLEHPVESTAMLAAPFAAAGVSPAAGVAIGATMAGSMALHIAQYGWQKAHELVLSPEDRATAEADPNRISGESAAMQAIMLGLGPLIHVGVKAASLDVGAGMMESGASGVAGEHLGPAFRPGFAEASGDAAKAEALQRAVNEHADVLQQDAALRAEVARQNTGRREVIAEHEAAIHAEELRQEELTRQAALRALTGVRRRPQGVPQTVEEARAADAAQLLNPEPGATASASPTSAAPLYFETPKGAELLGTMAARHGMPDTASPYQPDTPNDAAWKEGHDVASGKPPDAFSMGGALTDNRIPSDYSPARLPRTEPASAPGEPTVDGPSPGELGPTFKGPASLYQRLSDDALGAEYRALVERRAEEQPKAIAPLWDAEREARAVDQIENRRRPDGTLAPADKRRLANLQAAQGEEYGVGRHTFESAAAERRVAEMTKHITAIEKEIGARGLQPDELLRTPASAEGGVLTPIEGTGDTRTRGLAAGVEQRAVAKDLTDYLGDLPEYRTVNMTDQAASATRLLAEQPELARRVALGEVDPPKGLIPEAVFKAVESKALAEGDVGTLRDLASGGLTEQATTMGQRIRALAERDPESPVAAIQRVADARERLVGDVSEATAKTVKAIQAQLRKATIDPAALTDLINSLRC